MSIARQVMRRTYRRKVPEHLRDAFALFVAAVAEGMVRRRSK